MDFQLYVKFPDQKRILVYLLLPKTVENQREKTLGSSMFKKDPFSSYQRNVCFLISKAREVFPFQQNQLFDSSLDDFLFCKELFWRFWFFLKKMFPPNFYRVFRKYVSENFLLIKFIIKLV
jgi:hypothetical protein